VAVATRHFATKTALQRGQLNSSVSFYREVVMFRFVALFAILFLLFGCGEESSSSSKIPDDIEYSVIKDEKKRDIKRSIDVSLNKKVTSTVLKEIALVLKHSDTKSYQRTFIGYFLAGEGKNQGYWATTHFNPELEVRIIGLSIEDERVLTKKATPKPERNIIGSWLDDGVGRKMTLYYSNDNLFLESTYSDGSSGVKEMSEHSYIGGKKIEDKDGNDFGEYFVINESGRLEFWGKSGNYYTAKKLP
jgi:hypothetical protein